MYLNIFLLNIEYLILNINENKILKNQKLIFREKHTTVLVGFGVYGGGQAILRWTRGTGGMQG